MREDMFPLNSPAGGGGPGFFKPAGVPTSHRVMLVQKPLLGSPAAKHQNSVGPGFWDQVNPLSLRGNSPKDYTKWFDERFPRAIAGAKDILRGRINNWVHNNGGGKPKTAPAMSSVFDDVAVKADMHRFHDRVETWYEKQVRIGSFELKTDAATVDWFGNEFTFTAVMYVSEQTGVGLDELLALDRTSLLWPFFAKRIVRMGEWEIVGSGNSQGDFIVPGESRPG